MICVRRLIVNESVKKLTPKQARVLAILVGGGSITDAAASTGYSRTCIYSWMQKEHFQAELVRSTQESVGALSRSLVALGLLARQTLRDAITNPGTPPAVKVRAADIILARLLQLMEMVEFEKRLERLEQEVLHGNERETDY